MTIYYIPSGPANLAEIFPTIDWNQVTDYYLQVTQTEGGDAILTSTLFSLGCCCGDPDSKIRIFFYNHCGDFDGMNFTLTGSTHESKGSLYQRSLPIDGSKPFFSTERFNVLANDTIECKNTCYRPEDERWIKELLDSSKAYMQYDFGQDQGRGYIPIVIQDGNYERSEVDGLGFMYKIILKFKFSSDRMLIRN